MAITTCNMVRVQFTDPLSKERHEYVVDRSKVTLHDGDDHKYPRIMIRTGSYDVDGADTTAFAISQPDYDAIRAVLLGHQRRQWGIPRSVGIVLGRLFTRVYDVRIVTENTVAHTELIECTVRVRATSRLEAVTLATDMFTVYDKAQGGVNTLIHSAEVVNATH